MPAKYDLCEKGMIVLVGGGKVIGIPGKEVSYIVFVVGQNNRGIIISLKSGEQIKWPLVKADIYIRLLSMLNSCDRYYYVLKGADKLYVVENEMELSEVITG